MFWSEASDPLGTEGRKGREHANLEPARRSSSHAVRARTPFEPARRSILHAMHIRMQKSRPTSAPERPRDAIFDDVRSILEPIWEVFLACVTRATRLAP